MRILVADIHTHQKEGKAWFNHPTIMFKPTILISSLLLIFVTYANGNPHTLTDDSSAQTVTFIKPKASVMRRLNPLKIFFTVAHTPSKTPHYSVEWNFRLLKTMFLESKNVSDVDKMLYVMKFGNAENDFANWSPEEQGEFERFTEKYLNIYKPSESFLPFVDCHAVTYALTDEMIYDLQPNISDEKRSILRGKAVERLCESK